MYRQAPSFAYHDLGIVEDGDTASQAIEKDKFVIWKGESYFASTDILQGATLEEDVNLTAIPDGVINGVVSALNNNFVYSTNEQVIGTWITGDTLYRRVIPNLTIANAYTYDLTAANIKEMIDAGGFAISPDGSGVFTFNSMDSGGTKALAIYKKSTKHIEFWMSTGTWNATLILTYTKNEST